MFSLLSVQTFIHNLFTWCNDDRLKITIKKIKLNKKGVLDYSALEMETMKQRFFAHMSNRAELWQPCFKQPATF